MRRLEGKRAVVTGGGSGIGRASAIRFAREGAAVLVVGRSANTSETVEAIRAEGGVASGMITDASKEENVAAIVERCVNELGGLEVFFANIGVTGTNTPLLEQTVEEWAEVYRHLGAPHDREGLRLDHPLLFGRVVARQCGRDILQREQGGGK
jgi:NAD(P)-dependent dehydrogenase (short-subunit alcohol dehydrogenase family)